ncbi:Uncharacterized protein dnm_052850 [Desulfonema magnum]|uniref:Uncharacterized protein n=1 Tax=Desulfonema magnum TaxID=45655 RepID=A0A975GPW1_9BACT|nr:Uncharacterized protein dnm_052850 [Desulfonema magnum]
MDFFLSQAYELCRIHFLILSKYKTEYLSEYFIKFNLIF